MIINSGFSSGGGRKSVTVYATLLASGWEWVNVYNIPQTRALDPGWIYVCRQTVNVSGMTESATAIVSLDPSAVNMVAQAAASAMLRAVEQANGTVTIEAAAYTAYQTSEDIPIEVDIPIQVTIL